MEIGEMGKTKTGQRTGFPGDEKDDGELLAWHNVCHECSPLSGTEAG
jgi:hypothetical protein